MNEKENTGSLEKSVRLTHIVDVKMWIALAAIILIVITAGIWFFFGIVQTRQEVTCFIVRRANITTIYATEDCIILDISIETGDVIEKGAVIARTEQHELVDNINAMISRNAPEAEISSARAELISKMNIYCYGSGSVTEVYIKKGDLVKKGDKLATVSDSAGPGKNVECYAVVPFDEIKHIKKGMKVSVSPDVASAEDYGYISGNIAFISEYPLTYQSVYEFVGNDEIARELLKNGSCFAVEISLVASETTATGYEWTTSSGPSKPFSNLEFGKASIIVSEKSPYELFME